MAKPYYQDKHATIYHGDCREVLPVNKLVDLVCTDPPYGLKESRHNATHGPRDKLAKARDYGNAAWDDAPPDSETLSLVIGCAEFSIIFGGNYFGLPASPCWLVWDKDNTGDFADAELAWTNLKKGVRLVRWRWNGMLQQDMKNKEYREHPTQKPVPVMRWCIEQAPKDCETILDPFMGVGSTLVAAKSLGKKSIGIELSERYCEIAAKRLAQEVLPL